jgi:hypothetical protein
VDFALGWALTGAGLIKTMNVVIKTIDSIMSIETAAITYFIKSLQ